MNRFEPSSGNWCVPPCLHGIRCERNHTLSSASSFSARRCYLHQPMLISSADPGSREPADTRLFRHRMTMHPGSGDSSTSYPLERLNRFMETSLPVASSETAKPCSSCGRSFIPRHVVANRQHQASLDHVLPIATWPLTMPGQPREQRESHNRAAACCAPGKCFQEVFPSSEILRSSRAVPAYGPGPPKFGIQIFPESSFLHHFF